MPFDYRTATASEIMAMARRLVGQRIAGFAQLTGSRTKGDIGHALERYFGIPRNALSRADFPGAGIELKVVPVIGTPVGPRVKERTDPERIPLLAPRERPPMPSAPSRKQAAERSDGAVHPLKDVRAPELRAPPGTPDRDKGECV